MTDPRRFSSHERLANELEPGTVVLGRYRIDAPLASGGMAQVYRATQVSLGRQVAVKRIHPDAAADPSQRERFRREARAIARLHHPNVVELFDFGAGPQGEFYLIMELAHGESLAERLGRVGTLSAAEAHDLAIQCLGALAAVHAAGIVHRDIKPANIMLTPTPCGRTRVRLIDFGVCLDPAEAEGDVRLTRTGCFVGSPAFVAPELATGQVATPQSDLYTLATVLWEAITGRPLFDHPDPVDLIRLHISSAPPCPELAGVALAGPLVDFVMACLRKEPPRRPASAKAARAVLRRVAPPAAFSPRAPLQPNTPRPLGRLNHNSAWRRMTATR